MTSALSHPVDAAGPDGEEPSATLMLVQQVVFPKLALRYGARLSLMYQGLDQQMVMADWATELDGVRVEAITYALKHLPASDFPPNITQFRAICNQMPDEPVATVPKQRRLTHDGSNVPEAVRQFGQQLHHDRDEPGQEPRRIRTARGFIARVTAPEHRITPNEREWLDHYRTMIANWDASQLNTASLKAATQAKVDAYMQGGGDAPAHG